MIGSATLFKGNTYPTTGWVELLPSLSPEKMPRQSDVWAGCVRPPADGAIPNVVSHMAEKWGPSRDVRIGGFGKADNNNFHVIPDSANLTIPLSIHHTLEQEKSLVPSSISNMPSMYDMVTRPIF